MSDNDTKFKANFLWDNGLEPGSIEEAGYEFANAGTPEHQETWWNVLLYRISVEHEHHLRSRLNEPLIGV